MSKKKCKEVGRESKFNLLYECFKIDFVEKLSSLYNGDSMFSKKEIKVKVPKHRKKFILINNIVSKKY